jgi:8-oxo-dGTP diphosphatase
MSADAASPRRVRAAGGIVRRVTADGSVEVLVVHRPRYDDWTFPKGKAEPDEPDEVAARREVEEETGYRCRLGAEAGRSEYTDGRGRRKVVRYWIMDVDDGEFVPNDEVDGVEWLSPASARDRLTYERDRSLLDLVATQGEGSPLGDR